MNVGEDRKVVLVSLKEVPEEITFLLSDAEQDPYIKHRYWFQFPAQWANIHNKDPIIGIRSLYTTKTNRYIQYSYKIELIPVNTTEAIDTVEGTIRQWLDGSDTIRPIAEFFNDRWLPKTSNDDETHYGVRTHTCEDEEHNWVKYEVMCYYGFDRDSNKTNLCFGRGILASDTVLIKDSEDFETECFYQITITPESDDAKALFGSNDSLANDYETTHKSRLEIPVWSRYECLVKSSIANNDKNNRLGYTRNQAYTPIKYYRLNAGDKRFWVELYETRFPSCPVSFPKKVYETDEIEKRKPDRDDLVIEGIVAFSSEGMI